MESQEYWEYIELLGPFKLTLKFHGIKYNIVMLDLEVCQEAELVFVLKIELIIKLIIIKLYIKNI